MKNLVITLTRLLALAMLMAAIQSASAFYDPGLQRWLNRDPIGELGNNNLYGFVDNTPVTHVDSLGLRGVELSCKFLTQVGAIAGTVVGVRVGVGIGIIVGAPEGGVGAIPGAIAGGIGVGFVGGGYGALLFNNICKAANAAGRATARAIENTKSRPPKGGPCDFYAAWCDWANNRPADDKGTGWKRNAPCAECYEECQANGKWPFQKCPMGGPNGPRWPAGGKWPGGGGPVWPTPGQY